MTDAPVAIFKRGKGRPTTARKRSASPSSSSAPAGPSTNINTNTSASADVVVRPTKKGAANILSSGTKRTASEREREDDAVDVHWATSGAQSVSSSALEILAGDEAEEMLAKRQRRAAPEDEDDAFANDGQYHGMKAYGNKIKKQQEVAKTMRVGPVRMASSTIRTATIVDYQPDVCKDYKETGYCGFGDSRKFLHDRGTYLSGWQIDKKWDELQRNKGGRGGAEESSSSDSDEDIPFACLICRKPYTDPVVTRCGHYFCSACAIKRFAKTPKCIACGAPTNGIFNRADKVIERMKKLQTDKDAPGDEDGDGGDGAVPVEGLDAPSDDE